MDDHLPLLDVLQVGTTNLGKTTACFANGKTDPSEVVLWVPVYNSDSSYTDFDSPTLSSTPSSPNAFILMFFI